jgi:hypothetical protein
MAIFTLIHFFTTNKNLLFLSPSSISISGKGGTNKDKEEGKGNPSFPSLYILIH